MLGRRHRRERYVGQPCHLVVVRDHGQVLRHSDPARLQPRDQHDRVGVAVDQGRGHPARRHRPAQVVQRPREQVRVRERTGPGRRPRRRRLQSERGHRGLVPGPQPRRRRRRTAGQRDPPVAPFHQVLHRRRSPVRMVGGHPVQGRGRMPGRGPPLHQHRRNRQLRRPGPLPGAGRTGVPVRGEQQPVRPGGQQPVGLRPVLDGQVPGQAHGQPRSPRLDHLAGSAHHFRVVVLRGRHHHPDHQPRGPRRGRRPAPAGPGGRRRGRRSAGPPGLHPADHPVHPVDLSPGRHRLDVAPQGDRRDAQLLCQIRHAHAAPCPDEREHLRLALVHVWSQGFPTPCGLPTASVWASVSAPPS